MTHEPLRPGDSAEPGEPAGVAVVAVTYHPDDRLERMLDAVTPQVGSVWIVDNGSGPATGERLQARAEASGGTVKVILNAENLGLATAQNQGIAAALDAGAEWVLLLDDDSIPEPEMVTAMLRAANTYHSPERIGFLSPVHDNEGDRRPAPAYRRVLGVGFRRYWLGADGADGTDDRLIFAMASGSLIPARVLRRVGPMREDFWIDYIDYDFSFRVRREGYRILGVGDAVLNHRLGERHEREVLGQEMRYRSHPAFRRYTIYRNRIRVWGLHGARFPEFLSFELMSIAKDLIRLVLFESDKGAKIRAILAGIRDGFAGRGGFREF